MMESRDEERLDEDVAQLAEQLADLGAIDVYVLPPAAAGQLIDAREKAFWVAKANHADDIFDVVVPRRRSRSSWPRSASSPRRTSPGSPGCGHAGDGNVHLSIFQSDPEIRYRVTRELFRIGMDLGGAISGEHGIGEAKKRYYLELEDPVKVDLMRRIKTAFDPAGILNPGTIFETGDQP